MAKKSDGRPGIGVAILLRRARRVPLAVKLATMLPLAMALAVIGWEPAAAAAVNTGNCQYFLNGSPSTLFDTPDHALRVSKDQSVTVSGTSPDRFYRYEVDLQYAMFTFKAAEGKPDGPTFSTSVKVADYARYGAGTYKVVSNAETSGPHQEAGSCAADAYVFIAQPPLDTIAGIVGAGAAGVGVAGVLAGAGAAGTEGGGTTDEWEKQHPETERPAMTDDPNVGEDTDRYGEDRTPVDQVLSLGCFGPIIPMTFLLALVAVGALWALGVLGAG
jgi:hypothetical protein